MTHQVETGKRIVVYYQSHHHDGALVSTRELLRRCPELTAVNVGAIHLNDPPGNITLNDDSHDDPCYDEVWADLAEVQAAGGLVIGMLGGAAVGSYQRLDGTAFETYYPALAEFVRQHRLDGLDLDIEEEMSLAGVVRLIDRLHQDFGEDFVITMAPVATALSGGGTMSGFDHEELYRMRGDAIAWMNAQFYCGWGSLETTAGYDAIMARGVLPASKVVAGTTTHPMHGAGYVDPLVLRETVATLSARYPGFGGVSSWEYFNSEPGGTLAPWEWAQAMAASLAEPQL